MSDLIRKADLEIILSGAAALQNRDFFREAVDELKHIGVSDDLPADAVYEMAEKSLGLSRDYIEKFRQTRFPSRKQQLKTIEILGAGHPVFLNHDLREKYSVAILDSLKAAFPSSEFLVRRGNESQNGRFYDNYSLFSRAKRVKKLFGEGTKLKPEEFGIYSMSLRIDGPDSETENLLDVRIGIHDASFAEACRDTLTSLRDKFGKFMNKYSVYCSYIDNSPIKNL